jgi:hypothetical protein
VWASVNLLWVGFDLTYVPLRTFWLQRTLYPFPSLPLAVPLTLLPSITPYYDPIKGIEPHRQTQAYLAAFRQLDQQLLVDPATPAAEALRRRQRALTDQIIDENPFLVWASRAAWKRSKTGWASGPASIPPSNRTNGY